MTFFKVTANITKKDWVQHAKAILMFTVGMFIPLVIPRDDIRREMMAGILLGAAFLYSHCVIGGERFRRTLPLLLGRSRSRQLV